MFKESFLGKEMIKKLQIENSIKYYRKLVKATQSAHFLYEKEIENLDYTIINKSNKKK